MLGQMHALLVLLSWTGRSSAHQRRHKHRVLWPALMQRTTRFRRPVSGSRLFVHQHAWIPLHFRSGQLEATVQHRRLQQNELAQCRLLLSTSVLQPVKMSH